MPSFTEFFKKKDLIVDIIEVDVKETKIADLKVKNGDLIVIYRKSPYWGIVEKTDTSYQILQSYKGIFKYW